MKAKYAFMREHVREFRLCAMCRVLVVQRSGYYAWLRQQASAREREDERLLGRIKHFWLASGAVYGHRKITLDLREAGAKACARRWATAAGRAFAAGPMGVIGNVLDRAPTAPNKVWVTDITCIRTYEGWLFLAAVMDLYSRQRSDPRRSASGDHR